MDCKTCNVPDVNCYEQCKQEDHDQNKCEGCFGASFNDCADCEKEGDEDEEGDKMAMKQDLKHLFNTLCQIETNGHNTIIMGDCLRFLEQLINKATE